MRKPITRRRFGGTAIGGRQCAWRALRGARGSMNTPSRGPSLLKHGRPSGRPQRTTRQTEAMARFGIRAFELSLSLSRGFGPEHQVFTESLILAQDERWRRA